MSLAGDTYGTKNTNNINSYLYYCRVVFARVAGENNATLRFYPKERLTKVEEIDLT